MITGAATAYGLTNGGYNAAEIGLTPIGMRVVRPTTQGDDLSAKREVLLKPRIPASFFGTTAAAKQHGRLATFLDIAAFQEARNAMDARLKPIRAEKPITPTSR